MSATETHLATGWDTSEAIDDTITRRYLFHWAEACAAFADAAGGRVLRTPEVIVADSGAPSGYFNAAVLLKPTDGDDLDEVLGTVESFVAGGRGTIDLWSLWPLADISDRGWRLEGHPPMAIRPPATAIGIPDPGGDLDIRPVTDPASLADWERVAIEGYPLDELDADVTGRLAGPRVLDDHRLGFWVGYQDGHPVSIGTLFAEEDMASLSLGVTRPEARGRGHWAHHAARRIQAAPDVWFSGVFSDDSRPLAERIGFVPVTRFALWTLARP